MNDEFGRVTVRAMVNPAGKVSTITVSETPSEELGRCVATAVRAATFPLTQRGGVFNYPFEIR